MAAKDELIAGQKAQLEEQSQRVDAVRDELDKKTAELHRFLEPELPESKVLENLLEDYRKATADVAALKQTNEALTAKVHALENQLKARGGTGISKGAAPKK